MKSVSTERPRGRVRVRISRIVASAAGAVVLLACLAIAVGYITGDWRVQPVPTGSMAPAIPAGAAIVAQPVPVTDLTVGDVIVFRAPIADHQRLTVHRVVKIEEQDGMKVVTTQGDANDLPDPWRIRLHSDEVHRVSYVIPHAGSAVTWLRNPWFRLATILIGGALILVTGLRAIWRRPGSGDPSEPQDPPDPAAPPVPGFTDSRRSVRGS
jgi:signal peptidase